MHLHTVVIISIIVTAWGDQEYDDYEEHDEYDEYGSDDEYSGDEYDYNYDYDLESSGSEDFYEYETR